MIQCSSCYSTVSALLTNPLPDRSNDSSLLPHPLAHSGSILHLVSSGQTLYQAAPLENNTSLLLLIWRSRLCCCSALLQNLTQEKRSALRNNKQRQVSVPYPPLQIVNYSVTFCLFSLYLYPLSAPFLNPLSTPSPPSLFSLLINSLSS